MHPHREFAYIALDAIKPDPKNARKHSKDQTELVARSIDILGFNAPLLLDDNYRLVAGHCRLEAAKSLGLTEAPVVFLKGLSEAQIRAFQIADNQMAKLSSWDDTALALIFQDLQAAVPDFDLSLTGFSLPEIDIRIQSLGLSAQKDDSKILDFPEKSVSQSSDLWQLGPHRLLHGNACDQACVERVMDGNKAALLLSDPPYNMPIQGFVSKKATREFPMASGEMSKAEFALFLEQTTRNAVSYCAPGALIYLFIDWRNVTLLQAVGEKSALEPLNICVWVKPNGGMGSFYRSQHEFVCVFRKGKGRHKNNVQLGRFGRNRTNVWQYPHGPKIRQAGKLSHPTIKPVALLTDAIIDASDRGDWILDPFMGSGSLLLAAEASGRKAAGIELDGGYIDLAIKRWQEMTGKDAIHAATGRSFDSLSKERHHEKV